MLDEMGWFESIIGVILIASIPLIMYIGVTSSNDAAKRCEEAGGMIISTPESNYTCVKGLERIKL